jgi:hypothetical protein
MMAALGSTARILVSGSPQCAYVYVIGLDCLWWKHRLYGKEVGG